MHFTFLDGLKATQHGEKVSDLFLAKHRVVPVPEPLQILFLDSFHKSKLITYIYSRDFMKSCFKNPALVSVRSESKGQMRNSRIESAPETQRAWEGGSAFLPPQLPGPTHHRRTISLPETRVVLSRGSPRCRSIPMLVPCAPALQGGFENHFHHEEELFCLQFLSTSKGPVILEARIISMNHRCLYSPLCRISAIE